MYTDVNSGKTYQEDNGCPEKQYRYAETGGFERLQQNECQKSEKGCGRYRMTAGKAKRIVDHIIADEGFRTRYRK